MRHIDMIGTPLDHVRSPDLLNRSFRDRGEAITMTRRELAPGDLAGWVAEVRQDREAIGAVVTTPLKQAVLAHLDEQTPLVTLLGACNCIRFGDDGWVGANFDGFGFVAAHAAVDATGLDGKRVLLVGCGGAGSAIAASLVQEAEIALTLCDIDHDRAAAFARRLAAFAPAARIETTPIPAGAFDLVINASTAGMHPGDPSPIPAETVAAATTVADIVTVEDTALKRTAAELGKRLVVGDAMVAGQISLFRRFLLGAARTERDALKAKDA
ncbi:MAG: hypothetical protein KDJ88_00090 [Bauldia sp.]|nr:hypothetical protein [Bauldia sp.]